MFVGFGQKQYTALFAVPVFQSVKRFETAFLRACLKLI
jgi:hypothetical protein